MTVVRQHLWDLLYAALLIAAVPAAIYHAVGGRWPQAILVTAAGVVGALLLVTGWNEQREAPRQKRELFGPKPVDSQRHVPERQRDDVGRYVGCISLGAISGFIATGIMTAMVLVGYGISALLASDAEGANTIQQWFAALVDNTVTETAVVNPAVAIALHLIAGIAWGIIYAVFVEPRLSGPPIWQGALFSLIPWVLSVVVFFPLVGAGFFGLDIGAGPLPIIGNLLLHLAYGVTLGKMYASNAIWDISEGPVPDEEIEIMEIAERTMAIGLIPGLVLGLLAGAILSTLVTPGLDIWLSSALGALVGSAVGVWVGSLAGLSGGAPRSKNQSQA